MCVFVCGQMSGACMQVLSQKESTLVRVETSRTQHVRDTMRCGKRHTHRLLLGRVKPDEWTGKNVNERNYCCTRCMRRSRSTDFTSQVITILISYRDIGDTEKIRWQNCNEWKIPLQLTDVHFQLVNEQKKICKYVKYDKKNARTQ